MKIVSGAFVILLAGMLVLAVNQAIATRQAGWVVSVGQDGGRAFCVVEDAMWELTGAGWMLREVAK